MDVDVADDFLGPGFRSARQMLCGEASCILLVRFLRMWAVALGLKCRALPGCLESRASKPEIINNEKNHLAYQDAPKERRRGRAEKRLSKRVVLESPFLLCPLKVFS